MAANRRSRKTRVRTKSTLQGIRLEKRARVSPDPAASPTERKGLQITTARSVLHIRLNLALRRKDAWLLVLAACLALILLASSINEDIRSILVEALLGLLQVLVFGERKNR